MLTLVVTVTVTCSTYRVTKEFGRGTHSNKCASALLLFGCGVMLQCTAEQH